MHSLPSTIFNQSIINGHNTNTNNNNHEYDKLIQRIIVSSDESSNSESQIPHSFSSVITPSINSTAQITTIVSNSLHFAQTPKIIDIQRDIQELFKNHISDDSRLMLSNNKYYLTDVFTYLINNELNLSTSDKEYLIGYNAYILFGLMLFLNKNTNHFTYYTFFEKHACCLTQKELKQLFNLLNNPLLFDSLKKRFGFNQNYDQFLANIIINYLDVKENKNCKQFYEIISLCNLINDYEKRYSIHLYVFNSLPFSDRIDPFFNGRLKDLKKTFDYSITCLVELYVKYKTESIPNAPQNLEIWYADNYVKRKRLYTEVKDKLTVSFIRKSFGEFNKELPSDYLLAIFNVIVKDLEKVVDPVLRSKVTFEMALALSTKGLLFKNGEIIDQFPLAFLQKEELNKVFFLAFIFNLKNNNNALINKFYSSITDETLHISCYAESSYKLFQTNGFPFVDFVDIDLKFKDAAYLGILTLYLENNEVNECFKYLELIATPKIKELALKKCVTALSKLKSFALIDQMLSSFIPANEPLVKKNLCTHLLKEMLINLTYPEIMDLPSFNMELNDYKSLITDLINTQNTDALKNALTILLQSFSFFVNQNQLDADDLHQLQLTILELLINKRKFELLHQIKSCFNKDLEKIIEINFLKYKIHFISCDVNTLA
ncbi:hypothetical protein BN1013_02175 [Candidatus Rubidus massiliensis]|nr:hypothetical protein BN1013_02175 [Candidatus Rubidus massiliensis]